MSMRDRADIGAADEATRDALTQLVLGDLEAVGEALELRDAALERSGLDPRSFALVKIAALIALGAPPASYLWQVSNALDAGVTPREILGVLRALAPEIGQPRVVAAAPEIMVALGLSLPEGFEGFMPSASRPSPGPGFDDEDEDEEEDEDGSES